MNIKRGLFRIWGVLTILWVTGVSYVALTDLGLGNIHPLKNPTVFLRQEDTTRDQIAASHGYLSFEKEPYEDYPSLYHDSNINLRLSTKKYVFFKINVNTELDQYFHEPVKIDFVPDEVAKSASASSWVPPEVAKTTNQFPPSRFIASSISAQSADGVIHNFPANTPTTTIDKVMKNYANKKLQPKIDFTPIQSAKKLDLTPMPPQDLLASPPLPPSFKPVTDPPIPAGFHPVNDNPAKLNLTPVTTDFVYYMLNFDDLTDDEKKQVNSIILTAKDDFYDGLKRAFAALFIPPPALLLLGSTLFWIVDGFRRKPA